MNTNNFRKLLYLVAFWPAMLFTMAMLFFVCLTGCYVPDQGYYYHGRGKPNRGPIIEAVKASCHYNYTYDDYMWYFDAWVHYPRYDFEEVRYDFEEVR